MGTKNNPGAFDCYAAADPDEEMFILLARDDQSPARVFDWANKREERLVAADELLSVAEVERARAKIDEARDCARRMLEQCEEVQDALRQGIPLAELRRRRRVAIQMGPLDV